MYSTASPTNPKGKGVNIWKYPSNENHIANALGALPVS